MTSTVRYTHVTWRINHIKGRKRWYFVFTVAVDDEVVARRCGVAEAPRDDDDGRRNRCLLYANVRSKAPLVNGWCVFIYLYVYIIQADRACVRASAHASYTVVAKTFMNIIHYIASNIPYYETAFDKTLSTLPRILVSVPPRHARHAIPLSRLSRCPALQTLTTLTASATAAVHG